MLSVIRLSVVLVMEWITIITLSLVELSIFIWTMTSKLAFVANGLVHIIDPPWRMLCILGIWPGTASGHWIFDEDWPAALDTWSILTILTCSELKTAFYHNFWVGGSSLSIRLSQHWGEPAIEQAIEQTSVRRFNRMRVTMRVVDWKL